MTPTHVFAWGNNDKRATLKGRPLRTVASGAKQSCLIEFTDNGQREVVSRRALRVRRAASPLPGGRDGGRG